MERKKDTKGPRQKAVMIVPTPGSTEKTSPTRTQTRSVPTLSHLNGTFFCTSAPFRAIQSYVDTPRSAVYMNAEARVIRRMEITNHTILTMVEEAGNTDTRVSWEKSMM